MAKSFLFRLVAGSGKRREDFFTECLAGLFRLDRNLLQYVLRNLLATLGRPGFLDQDSDLSVATQVSFPVPRSEDSSGRVRPDLVIYRGQTPWIFVECKLGADFAQNQMPTYLDLADQFGGYLLLLSASPRQIAWDRPSERYLGNVLWTQVHRVLSEYKGKAVGRLAHLLQEVLWLMEDLEMTQKPVRCGAAKVYADYLSLMDSMQGLVERARKLLRSEWADLTEGSVSRRSTDSVNWKTT